MVKTTGWVISEVDADAMAGLYAEVCSTECLQSVQEKQERPTKRQERSEEPREEPDEGAWQAELRALREYFVTVTPAVTN